MSDFAPFVLFVLLCLPVPPFLGLVTLPVLAYLVYITVQEGEGWTEKGRLVLYRPLIGRKGGGEWQPNNHQLITDDKTKEPQY